MGHGNEIGRIGRREVPVDPRQEPGPVGPENGGVVPPGKVAVPAEPPAGLPELKDGYVPQPMTDPSALNGEGGKVPLGVSDLVPNLSQMAELGQLPQRFAADMVLVRAQLSMPGIPPPEQADRLFQFFVAYAERFVEMATAVEGDAGAQNQGDPSAKQGDGKAGGKAGGKLGGPQGELSAPELSSLWGETVSMEETPLAQPPRVYTPEEKATEVRRFTQVLREAGFSELRDPATGRDGAQVAARLLLAKSPEEVQRQAQRVQLLPTQEAPASASPRAALAEVPRELPRDARPQMPPPQQSAQAPRDAARPVAVEGRPELRLADGGGMRVQPFALPASQVAAPVEGRADAAEEPAVDRLGDTHKRLGPRMFWNVLHTFRGQGDDSAVFQDKWDKLTFGALLLLVLVALAVIALVSL